MEKIELPNEVLLGEVTELLKEGKNVILMTKGNSMLPFIIGDRDSVELTSPDVVKENDIVLALLKNGMYVLHRVQRIDGDEITLMGDGNLRGTEHCRRNDICGLVRTIIKEDGRKVDCSDASLRRRVLLWHRLLPVRRYLLYIYRKLKHL